MAIIWMLIIWNWGLTPVWVNILITIMCGLSLFLDICKIIAKNGEK